MASWKIKGYVSDSDDDNEETTTFEFLWRVTEPHNHVEAEVAVKQPSDIDSQHIRDSLRAHADASESDDQPKGASGGCLDLIGSEDHRDERSSDHVEPQLETTSATTAEKLEQSLQKGFSLVQSALSILPQHTLPIYSFSDNDSPLSSLSSTPRASQHDRLNSARISTSQTKQMSDNAVPRRIFRERTIKQVMPYTTEQAKYLKSCAERGIRPVRLVKASSPTRKKVGEGNNDSQFEDESQDQELSGHHTLEVDFSYSDPTSHHRTRDASYNSDGLEDLVDVELPSLNDLFTEKQQLTGSRRKPSSKAAKFQHQSGTRDGHTYTLSSSDEENRTPLKRHQKYRQLTKQDSFPSPPRSMSTDSTSELLEHQGSTKANSPVGLPTPVISSGPRARKRLVIDDDTQSSPGKSTSTIAPPVSSDEHSEEDSNQSTIIRAMQKRVKGVLPASWWSVGRAQREMGATQKKSGRSYSRTERQAGVAKRTVKHLSRPVGTTSTSDFHGLLSDEESGTEPSSARKDNESLRANASHFRPPRSSSPLEPEALEAFDTDGIDPMMPVQKRSHKGPRQHILKSPSSRNSLGRQEKGSNYPILEGPENTAGIWSGRPRKRIKRKVSSNPIHVLDAPDLQSSKPSQLPPFLRLAAKKASKRIRPVHTDASRKFFQFETKEATQQVLEALGSPNIARDGSTRPKVRLNSILERSANIHNTETPNTQHGKSTSNKHDAARGSWLSNANRAIVQHSDTASKTRDAEATVERGLVIQCDDHQDSSLHLTRLNPLLPLPNRSGHGRFASQPTIARTAHIEVPLLTSRRTTHRLNDVIALRMQRSALRPLTPNVRQLQASRKAPQSLVKKPKKQAPIRRQNAQQSLLAPSSPKTSELEKLIGTSGSYVREALEKEFAEHHGAWFQGSKSGISVSNAKTQRHFHVFLDVLRSYLSSALQLADDARDARDLQSFLHRLIPNRGQIGAQGQIGDKVFDVLEYDVIVARNVFELHTSLLALAPGSAPRPRVLEMKVNFSDAHHEICLVALSAWTEIYKFHHSSPPIIEGLANWLYAILSQLLDRWKLAEIDARKEVAQSTHRIQEQLVRKVIEHNRGQANVLLLEAIGIMKQAVENAISVIETRSFFNVERYLGFLNSISKTPEMESEVLQAFFDLGVSYISEQWLLSKNYDFIPLLTGVREATKALTSRSASLPMELLHTVAKTFFSIASKTVDYCQRSWDSFVEPSSADSLDIFISESHLDIVKSFFYHLLIENYRSSYFLDFRPLVLLHWIRVLLQYHDNDSACSLLTASLFRNEKDSLSFKALSTKFQSSDTGLQDAQVLESLPEIRYATVLHIISTLQEQEDNSEAEWLVGGLDEKDGVRMLKTIFQSLKETWISLSPSPEKQDTYMILVHSALEVYRRRPRQDFTIDAWFSNSATFPQPRKQSLFDLLTDQKLSENDIGTEMRELFSAEIKHAQNYNRLQNFEVELKNALLLVKDHEEGFIELSDEISKRQSAFIRDVLCHYLAEYPTDNSNGRSTIFRILISMVENFECRADPSNVKVQRDVLEGMLSAVSVARSAFWDHDENDRELIYSLTSLVFSRAIVVLEYLPESLMGDVNHLCEYAAENGTTEGLSLLRTVASAA